MCVTRAGGERLAHRRRVHALRAGDPHVGRGAPERDCRCPRAVRRRPTGTTIIATSGSSCDDLQRHRPLAGDERIAEARVDVRQPALARRRPSRAPSHRRSPPTPRPPSAPSASMPRRFTSGDGARDEDRGRDARGASPPTRRRARDCRPSSSRRRARGPPRGATRSRCNAPRSLKEPVTCSHSSLSQTSPPASRESAGERRSGVRTQIPCDAERGRRRCRRHAGRRTFRRTMLRARPAWQGRLQMSSTTGAPDRAPCRSRDRPPALRRRRAYTLRASRREGPRRESLATRDGGSLGGRPRSRGHPHCPYTELGVGRSARASTLTGAPRGGSARGDPRGDARASRAMAHLSRRVQFQCVRERGWPPSEPPSRVARDSPRRCLSRRGSQRLSAQAAQRRGPAARPTRSPDARDEPQALHLFTYASTSNFPRARSRSIGRTIPHTARSAKGRSNLPRHQRMLA